jgi:hypothetical protein
MAGMFLALALRAEADPVAPAECVITNYRETVSGVYANTTIYYQGDTMQFTNCVMYATASGTNAALQNLDGCAIIVRSGAESTVVTNSGYVISTNAGTWGCVIPVLPAVNPCYHEVTVSNANTYTYGRIMIRTMKHLGE